MPITSNAVELSPRAQIWSDIFAIIDDAASGFHDIDAATLASAILRAFEDSGYIAERRKSSLD